MFIAICLLTVYVGAPLSAFVLSAIFFAYRVCWCAVEHLVFIAISLLTVYVGAPLSAIAIL